MWLAERGVRRAEAVTVASRFLEQRFGQARAGIPLDDQRPRGDAQTRAEPRIAEQPRERSGQGPLVPGRDEDRVLAVREHLRHDADARGDERAPRRQTLEDDT